MRAQQCVAIWLRAIDEGGAGKEALDLNAHVRHGFLKLQGDTALDVVRESNLLIDLDQRVEVARRRDAIPAAQLD